MRHGVVVLCSVLAVLLGAAALSACGEPDEDTTSGSLFLTVYTSGALHGDAARSAQDSADAVKLALAQAGGMAGPFTVNVVSYADTDPETGRWSADQAVANARRAISDRNIMAYISEGDSGAAAVTLPLLNEAGVLMIGPTTGYTGFTKEAGRGEPERFYPSGVRTFGRIAPADDVQADALVATMRERGARRLAVLHDGRLEAMGIASLVASRAREAGIRVVAETTVDTGDEDQSGLARDVAATGADAALYAGTYAEPAATVLDALHRADPQLALFAPDGLADETLAGAIAPGTARSLLLTSPAVPFDRLPAAAQRFERAFARTYGREPVPGAVFGYEAMRAILDAVRGAGTQGNDRSEVIRSYFALGKRSGPLGAWAIGPDGDTTLRRYGVWRVRDGALAFAGEASTGT